MQELHGTQVLSTYHFPGTFSGCLFVLSAIGNGSCYSRSKVQKSKTLTSYLASANRNSLARCWSSGLACPTVGAKRINAKTQRGLAATKPERESPDPQHPPRKLRENN
jgi:hypothetical protein